MKIKPRIRHINVNQSGQQVHFYGAQAATLPKGWGSGLENYNAVSPRSIYAICNIFSQGLTVSLLDVCLEWSCKAKESFNDSSAMLMITGTAIPKHRALPFDACLVLASGGVGGAAPLGQFLPCIHPSNGGCVVFIRGEGQVGDHGWCVQLSFLWREMMGVPLWGNPSTVVVLGLWTSLSSLSIGFSCLLNYCVFLLGSVIFWQLPWITKQFLVVAKDPALIRIWIWASEITWSCGLCCLGVYNCVVCELFFSFFVL